MKRFTVVSTVLFTSMWACYASAAIPVQPEPAPRHLAIPLLPDDIRIDALVRIAENSKPIVLQEAILKTDIIGRQLQHRIELILYNPNNRVLEGELVLPLGNGQRVTGFALDIAGELRPAVVVEKVKGRQVFEDTIRQQVDPALLEKTQGNQYKLRLYPLPEKGTRRVVLDIEKPLEMHDGKLQSVTPLSWLAGAKKRQHLLSISGWQASQIDIEIDDKKQLEFRQGETDILRNITADKQLKVTFAPNKSRQNTPVVSQQHHAGEHYLYAEVPIPTITHGLRSSQLVQTKPSIDELTVVWDASLSGLQRDRKRELDVLREYLFTQLKQQRTVKVNLIVVRNTAEALKAQRVNKDNLAKFIDQIQALSYDGASVMSDWNIPKSSDAVMVFTDGNATFQSNKAIPAQKTALLPYSPSTALLSPKKALDLMFVSSGELENTRQLSQWAKHAAGRHVSLSTESDQSAHQKLTTQQLRVTGVNHPSLKEVVLADVNSADGVIRFAAKIDQTQLGCAKKSCAELNLSLLDAGNRAIRKTLKLPITSQHDGELAAKRWADMRLDALSVDVSKNKKQILALAKEHRRITELTSLIVLDNVADYVQHRIEPPASLKEAYDKAILAENKQQQKQQDKHIDTLAKRYDTMKDWWEKDFPKDTPIKKDTTLQKHFGLASVSESAASADMAMGVAAAPAPSPMLRQNLEKSKKSAANNSAKTRIKIAPWSPKTAYVQTLAKLPIEQAYAQYLILRDADDGAYRNNPSFYLNVADFLYAKGRTHEATRVLSNLSEISHDDRDILRVLAYRLSQAKQYQQALSVLQRVAVLAPDEPQSWRDLGLAYADLQLWQPAVDNLWKVAQKNWQGRFSDIDLIALMEMNALAATQDVSTQQIDKRLLKNLPVGMRVVLAWDTDNSDMDLWVTDPNGETVKYSHPKSYQGGLMSRDFTGGYGPEQFILKAPKKGTYTVKAHFYGTRSQKVKTQTTLQLRFITDFGKPSEKSERVTLQLKPKSEVVTVGEFQVE